MNASYGGVLYMLEQPFSRSGCLKDHKNALIKGFMAWPGHGAVFNGLLVSSIKDTSAGVLKR